MIRYDYRGPRDLRAMQSLAERLWSPLSRWHVGDLAWGRHMHVGREPEWPTALWSNGDLLAWGWVELPDTLSLQVDPRWPQLAPDALRWFDEVAPAGMRSVTVLDSEQHLIAALLDGGYTLDATAPFYIHQVLRLETPIKPPTLPAGFRLRRVTPDDAAARATVHRRAFAPSRVSTASYRNVMKAWPYRQDLDWVVEAPDGELVAFALGWLDELNHAGELEPVGTHPAYRRLGLARAASLAALSALQRAGARAAVVYPRGDDSYPVPRALYEQLGFQPCARTLTFRRDQQRRRGHYD